MMWKDTKCDVFLSLFTLFRIIVDNSNISHNIYIHFKVNHLLFRIFCLSVTQSDHRGQKQLSDDCDISNTDAEMTSCILNY